ncbi:hypothetical protein LCGC14_1182530 [marine sediment metagenome]|uniref:Uncharacterized protein n=1 Tax=marine sediment metagenome TaxID=412755 RepID=A0A0F9LRI9_9ZZZZ|nr:MAG: hypothetical protein Lokiarch_40720 [Candidatus Lokiarchaeum sp. GC14_75]
MTVQTESKTNILRNYPFSLLDIDGLSELWKKIYNPYIDLIESNITISKDDSITTFRNHNFASKNEVKQRIADLIVIREPEIQKSNLGSKSLRNNLNKSKEKIEDQYSDGVEKENFNLKITFVFANKKVRPLKLIQLLKLSDEVNKYTQLLHKQLKQYSEITPQIIFLSLFGFEISIGDYLRDNLHGKIRRNISIMVVPPINNKLWNNYPMENSIEDNINETKDKWGLNFNDYKKLRNNGAVNKSQLDRMETYYKDLKDSKELSDYNYQHLNIWSDILSIKNSSTLLDIRNSGSMIKELEIK